MTTELYYLTLTALLTTLLWIPAGVDLTFGRGGLATALGNRENVPPLAPWAERAKRAHANAVENLVVFAALVLAAHAAGITNTTTQVAAALYFWMRLAHAIVYGLGIIGLRTIVWSIAWGCQLVFAWQLLTAV